MYCKYCGTEIADNSVFCSKCGKLVVEVSPQPDNQSPITNATQWVTTEKLQWRKPIVARYTQIIIIVILGVLLLYPLYCLISGGKVQEYYEAGYGLDRRHEVYVNDPWELKILKFTSVKMFNWRSHGGNIVRYGSFSKSDAQSVFRWKMLLVILPFIVLIWLTIRWMKWTRFPGEKDIVPRDVADEIEQYEWDGFTKYKYIFYKKSGKYGVLDARNYCVDVQAQYDSIVWRMPNRLFDGTIGGEKYTIKIKKPNPINPNKQEIDSTILYRRIIGIVLGLWGAFWTIVPVISLLDPDDKSEGWALAVSTIMGVASLIGAYYILKKTSSE